MKVKIIICFILLTQLTACDFIKQFLSADEGVGGGASDAELTTMGYYADGFNSMISSPHDCMKEYFGKIPLEGPQEEEEYSLFPRHSFAQNAMTKAKEAFEQGKKASPDKMKHLDSLAGDALKDLEKIVSTFEKAHKYYDAEDYKDDAAKLGKELHQKMLSLSESYKTKLNIFEEALSTIETQQMQAELKQFEKDKGYGYWFRLYNFEANQLVKVSDNEKFETAFLKLEKAYNDLKKFVDSKGDAINSVFKTYYDQSSRFYAEGKKIVRELKQEEVDLEKVSDMQNDLIGAYNSMIDVTNSLQNMEASNSLQ